jgi:hypothetical protein
MLFPVLKEHGEGLALGYVAARLLEVVLLFPAALDPGDARAYAGSSLFFCLGALILNALLFRSRLVPRWLSGWALAAVVPYVIDAGLVGSGALTVSSAVHPVLVAPLALNEMVLAVWLLTKGFRSAAG